jgi:glycosyltransferase involved in cell wall biosynthesis
MHIVYLHQYFSTRQGFSGTRSYEFAQYLVGRGHRVTMVHSGLANEERLSVPEGRRHTRVEIDGIECVPIAAGYANHIPATSMGGSRRMIEFMRFARLAGQVGKTLDPPDVVFASHTPLNIGLPAIKLARRFDVPFVFEVRDLWPDALINIGALTNPLGIAYLRRLERKIYRAADHIVALSPGMKAGIVATGIPEDQVTVIPNASDLDLFRPDIDRTPGRQRLGLGDRMAAIYFGTMGRANGLEYAIEAARILKKRENHRIVIVLHGQGGMRSQLEEMAADLDNVIFSNPVRDKREVAELVAGCDVALTIYRASQEHTWSPNKMFDSLAAGKPVLVNVPGWLTDTIENDHCGWGVSPEHPEQLADALEQLEADPAARLEMGRRARQLAEREFAREKLAARLESVLTETVRKRTTVAPH